MLDKHPDQQRGTVEVTFTLQADGFAQPVCLSGEFNGWAQGELPLEAAEDGTLTVTVPLTSGNRFEFRYHDAQGRWFNDPAADDYVANEWGGMNGVVAT